MYEVSKSLRGGVCVYVRARVSVREREQCGGDGDMGALELTEWIQKAGLF